MTTTPAPQPGALWLTRCPVPTATGLAYKLGWLADEFAADGIKVATLQEDAADGSLARHHYDHAMPALIREGGSMLSIAARAQGAPTRLIGLTWIDEGQAIIVRAGSGIASAAQLRGLRVALPAYSPHPIAAHARGSSIARGMTLHGLKGVLESAALTLDDVRWVEVEDRLGPPGVGGLWAGLEHLAANRVDAVYVKGAAAVDAAHRLGLETGIDIDRLPERRWRVNNGTPRPITVHEDLLERHFDLVVRFLERTLAAADWAADNLAGVQRVLAGETRGSDAAVALAYRDDFHRTLHPDLSDQRRALFRRQKDFLLLHGLLDADVDLDAWTDARPLQAALALREERRLAVAL